MNHIPRIFNRFVPQLLHMIVLPLFFFMFMLVYKPFGAQDILGVEWYGVHVTIISSIILVSVIIFRLIFYYLPLKLNYTLYILWTSGEIVVMSFFVALYIWLVDDKDLFYFDTLFISFKYLFLTLAIPYSMMSLSIRIYDQSENARNSENSASRMRFYDSTHHLKLVVTSDAVLYIGAEENYININYIDNGNVKSYVLRNSMKAVDELCLSNGLVRCHRSFYVNPSHIRVLRKEKEGAVFAELDAEDIRDIPVSKMYYDRLSDML